MKFLLKLKVSMNNSKFELQNKSIHPLIPSHFPEFYQEEGPVFIQFLTEYYKWLEGVHPSADLSFNVNGRVSIKAQSATVEGINTTFLNYFSSNDKIAIFNDDNKYNIFTIDHIANNTHLNVTSDYLPEISASNCEYRTVIDQKNVLYHSRRLLDNRDIDIAEDEFVLLFKEKYLKDLHFDTIIDIRKFIKYSLDLYRSKGTERSIDLLYKSVFGVPAKVYYPKKDLFTTSSGKWHIPRYIELSVNKNNHLLQNKTIQGLYSKATAFVDSIIRKNINNKLVDIAYISSINGQFQTDEKIVGANLHVSECPVMIGSLNYVRILPDNGGEGFNVGDELDIASLNGIGAKGRVVSVANNQGILGFELFDGGYGYTANAEVIISEQIITLSNIKNTTDTNQYFEIFDSIAQPVANIYYVNANGQFDEGSNIYSYDEFDDVAGIGKVIRLDLANTSSGYLLVSILEGNLDSEAIYSEGNTVGANLDIVSGYHDLTTTANVIGHYANTTLYLETEGFQIGETIHQPATGATGRIGGIATDNLNIVNMQGAFVSDEPVIGQISSTSANVITSTLNIGVKDIIGEGFLTVSNNEVFFGSANISAQISAVSQGSGGLFDIQNYIYTETVELNTDFLNDYVSVGLDDVAYGFPAEPSGNSTSHAIDDLLSAESMEIGAINNIIPLSFGSAYNRLPIALIYDSNMIQYGKLNMHDTQVLHLTNQTATFRTGELLIQLDTDARGIVKTQNSTSLTIKRMRYYDENQFIPTVNSATLIFGTESGSIANIVSTDTILSSNIYGNNAIINISLQQSNGVINEVQITDSGFGYFQNEEVILSSNGKIAFGLANNQTIGTGSGFYKDHNGFLSSYKKLFDGLYYSYHSYDVKSSVINTNKRQLKKITHTAGTKYFDSVEYDTKNDLVINGYTQINIE